jgi:hypothetical protein
MRALVRRNRGHAPICVLVVREILRRKVKASGVGSETEHRRGESTSDRAFLKKKTNATMRAKPGGNKTGILENQGAQSREG